MVEPLRNYSNGCPRRDVRFLLLRSEVSQSFTGTGSDWGKTFILFASFQPAICFCQRDPYSFRNKVLVKEAFVAKGFISY